MKNDIILIALPQDDVEEVRRLCELALKSINGEDAESAVLVTEIRDGKVQLRLKGNKSSTFMIVASEEARDTFQPQMPKIFEQTNMYIYTDFESFRDNLNSVFPEAGIKTEVEEVPDVVDELDKEDEIEELEEAETIVQEEGTDTFVIPSIAEESSESNLKAELATLKAQNENLEAELKEYRENDVADKKLNEELEEVRTKLAEVEQEKTRLEGELASSKENLEKAQQEKEAVEHLQSEAKEMSDNYQKSLNDKIEELQDEIQQKITEIEAKDNTIKALQESSSSNVDITESEEYIELSTELEDCVNELSSIRGKLSTVTASLNKSEKSYAKLEARYREVSDNIFTKVGKKALTTSVINDTVFSVGANNVVFVASGSCESVEDTANSIRRSVEQKNQKTVILDFDMGSYIDLYFGVQNKSNNTMLGVFNNELSIKDCLVDTNLPNCKYATISKGFVNESGLLTLNWGAFLNKLSSTPDITYIVNIGCINSLVKAILLNSATANGIETIVVTRATTLNIRAVMFAVAGIKNAKDASFVCFRHSGANVPAIFDTFSKKYSAIIESEEKLPEEV